jgi:hypothetical protein
MTAATFLHRSFKIGDAKDIDLNGQNILNAGIPILIRGTYTGNGTANRTVAHGLGRIPKLILVFNLTTASIIMQDATGGIVEGNSGGSSQIYSVTPADLTNFYIGFGASGFWGNGNLTNFSCIANTQPELARYQSYCIFAMIPLSSYLRAGI